MKKIYISTIGLAFSALLFLSVDANAQRRRSNDPGAEAPPAAGPATVAPQRVDATPPQQQQPRMAPPQQQQQQPQRNNPAQQSYTPPPQRSNNGSQSNWGGGRPRGDNNGNAVNSTSPQSPDNYNRGQRGNYNGNVPQRANNYNGQDRRGGSVNTNPQRSNYPGPRGNYNPNRIGVAPNRSYRSYPGLQYGRNRITTRPQGLYYRNRGYYGSYYAPRLGFSLNILPSGYYPFLYDQSQYYYSDGLYYQRNDDNYTVVEPPIGAEIKSLPQDAQSIVIDGVQYYESNGIYYQPVTKDDGTVTYQIAGKDGELNTDDAAMQDAPPPLKIGELVDSLPEESVKIKLNGQKYYVSPDGYYFQDAVDGQGNKVYKVAGTPEGDPDKN
jgi:hypothetical protein